MKILNPNEEGYGYIIEHGSGYITPELTCRDGVCSNQNLIREFKSGVNLGQDGEIPTKVEIYAVLQKYGVENKNGRIYPQEILKREAKKYQEFIDLVTSLGELNHPESSIIDADRVSHRITEIWWEGNTLMGKIKLLTSPGFHERGIVSCPADQAANLMRQGVTMGVSSRGVGTLVKKGEQNEVQDDFELICFDLVSSPSTPGAYLFLNKDDKTRYDENLEEERKINNEKQVSNTGLNKSLDLMNKLSHYLDN
jgi:hypothetical protein